MLKLQYSIRTLFILVLVVALAATAFRAWQFRTRWLSLRTKLDDWELKLDRSPGVVESFSFITVDFKNNRTVQFTIMTAEPSVMNNESGAYEFGDNANRQVDDSRYFILPLGVWVDSVAEAVREWDDYRLINEQHKISAMTYSYPK